MFNSDKKQLLKFIGGGLIIAVAFAIMAPGLTTYLMGLWRLITLIATIIAVAFLAVYVYHKLKTKKPPESQPTETESQDENEQ